MSEWQPIETAPLGVQILCYWKGCHQPYDVAIKKAFKWVIYENDICLSPDFWMPLPEPPND